jgi:hypothetical protein
MLLCASLTYLRIWLQPNNDDLQQEQQRQAGFAWCCMRSSHDADVCLRRGGSQKKD